MWCHCTLRYTSTKEPDTSLPLRSLTRLYMKVHGIHHVTAISAQIEKNLEFYTGVLGLRLVKKSVNQDDVSAYHLFYADKAGSPGTDMTFFDWPTIGEERPGIGSIGLTTFRVPGPSIDAWETRLREAGCAPIRDLDPADRSRITFSDPEGQRLALVDDDGLPNQVEPWTKVVPAKEAIRGILGVNLDSAHPDATRRVLTEVLGFQDIDGARFTTGSENSFGEIVVREPDGRGYARQGAGGVHHVAFRVTDDQALYGFQDRIESLGLRTSGYIDRFYFHSLYFREPGGVLFELATDGPGFASDESAETLGEKLALPPFLEGRRAEIEANLKPLTV